MTSGHDSNYNIHVLHVNTKFCTFPHTPDSQLRRGINAGGTYPAREITCSLSVNALPSCRAKSFASDLQNKQVALVPMLPPSISTETFMLLIKFKVCYCH